MCMHVSIHVLFLFVCLVIFCTELRCQLVEHEFNPYKLYTSLTVTVTDTVAQLVERRRDKSKVLGSNPGECHIYNLFRCVLFFSATLAKRWKVQFRLGLAINSATLILITAY